jgi:hypothetical protein
LNKVIKVFAGILVVMLPVGIIMMLSGEGGNSIYGQLIFFSACRQ